MPRRKAYTRRNPDERIALAVATDEQWPPLSASVDEPDWARDPALADASDRHAAHDAIDGRLRAWLGGLARDAAVEMLVGELGLSPADLAELRRKQVIGERPSGL